MMKITILILACVALSAQDDDFSKEQLEKLHVHIEKCSKQLGVTLPEVQFAARTPDVTEGKTKCFFNCVFEELGFLVNGNVKPDKVMATLKSAQNEESLKGVQAKCDSLKGSDNCDTAYKLAKCYFENLE